MALEPTTKDGREHSDSALSPPPAADPSGLPPSAPGASGDPAAATGLDDDDPSIADAIEASRPGAKVTLTPPAGFSLPLADLGAAIGDIYQRHLQRRATFEEVMHWLDRLSEGVTLPAMMSAIADSTEAVELDLKRGRRHRDRGTFAPELDLLYRATLGRPARAEEVDGWFDAHHEGLSLAVIASRIQDSEEAAIHRRIIDVSDGVFVQMAIEIVSRRGAAVGAIARRRADLQAGRITRPRLWADLFSERVAEEVKPASAHRNDTGRAWIAGLDRHVDRIEWAKRRAAPPAATARAVARLPFHPPAGDEPVVSIITSLFRGGAFIDFFLRNLAEQTIFPRCELIIVDAASDQGEEAKIAAFAADHPNVVYRRLDERVGIYRAWNMALGLARGRYVTNANLDDSRRSDSLEIQAATLDALSFVDVVTQDVFYSFEPNLPFDEIRRAGVRASFVNADRYSLMTGNPPHNAPMWRRRLHDELGSFDEQYRSAADYEFWLRCAAADKMFYRIADPHVAYFYNPDGLSTSATGSASGESDAIRLKHLRRLVAPSFLEEERAFAARLGDVPGGASRAEAVATDDHRANDRYRLVQLALVETARREAEEARR